MYDTPKDELSPLSPLLSSAAGAGVSSEPPRPITIRRLILDSASDEWSQALEKHKIAASNMIVRDAILSTPIDRPRPLSWPARSRGKDDDREETNEMDIGGRAGGRALLPIVFGAYRRR